MKYFLATIFFVALVVVIGCTKNTNKSNKVIVQLKNCTNVNDEYNLCFDSVLIDSRCPINAICVWEGYAKIQLSLQQNGKLFSFYLHTPSINNNFNIDTTVQNIHFKLDSLKPYPVYGAPMPNVYTAYITAN